MFFAGLSLAETFCVVARWMEDGLLSVMLAAETQMRCKKKKSLRKK